MEENDEKGDNEKRKSLERGKRERHTRSRTQEGLAPAPQLVFVHPMKHGIPHCSFDVGAVVFIKTMAWAASSATYLEGLTHFKIKVEFFFVFVGFVDDDCWFLPIDNCFTMLFVSGDS